MLDNLPAWLRHLTIVVGAVFLGTVAEAIVSAGGVSGLDLVATLVAACDAATVAGASVAAILWLTPVTRQYGVGAAKESKGDIHDVFPEDDSNI